MCYFVPTSHFLQVEVKSQVSYGCNEPSIICYMPSSLASKELNVGHHHLLVNADILYCLIKYMVTLHRLLQLNVKKIKVIPSCLRLYFETFL